MFQNLTSLEGLAPKEINLNEYTLAQERNDERFGLIFFMRSKSSIRTIFVKDRTKALTEDHLREISLRVGIKSNYLLKIYGIKQVPQSDTFQIYFEDFSEDLRTEIQRHITQGTRFTEAELYAILYSTIAALDCLQQNNISHEFIVPMNILKFTKDLYKLHDNFIISQRTYLYKQALRGNYQRYLAPELFESLGQKKETPEPYDPLKADIFSLGMCILDAGLLNSQGDFINRKLMILDERALERALNEFGDHYSSSMVQILEDMLFPDPSRRPDPTTLFRRLPGKPLVKGQTHDVKKKKPLDQIVNNNLPEAFDARTLPHAMSRSPTRATMETNPYSPNIRHTLQEPIMLAKHTPELFSIPMQHLSPHGERIPTHISPPRQHVPLHLSPPRQHVPLHLSPPGQHLPAHLSPPRPSRQPGALDMGRINVSDSIKNDPVLAQFVQRIHDPNYRPSITSPTAQQFPVLRQLDPNIPQTAQFPVRFSPRDQEIPVRNIPNTVPLGSTMKPIYNPAFLSPQHPQERPFVDTYKSGLLASAPGPDPRTLKPAQDQGPLRTYHLESIRTDQELRPLMHPHSALQQSPMVIHQAPVHSPLMGHPGPVILHDPREIPVHLGPHGDRYQRDSQSDSKRGTLSLDPRSRIDELIAKALERSTNNLFLSQQVSADVRSNLDSSQIGELEPSRPSYQSNSSAQANNGLGTILERPVSEGFVTPLDSKPFDPQQQGKQRQDQKRGDAPVRDINPTGQGNKKQNVK